MGIKYVWLVNWYRSLSRSDFRPRLHNFIPARVGAGYKIYTRLWWSLYPCLHRFRRNETHTATNLISVRQSGMRYRIRMQFWCKHDLPGIKLLRMCIKLSHMYKRLLRMRTNLWYMGNSHKSDMKNFAVWNLMSVWVYFECHVINNAYQIQIF